MSVEVWFVDQDNKLDQFVSRMDADLAADPAKYGIEIHNLTPRYWKIEQHSFSVRLRGRIYRGYISTRGFHIVRLYPPYNTVGNVTNATS